MQTGRISQRIFRAEIPPCAMISRERFTGRNRKYRESSAGTSQCKVFQPAVLADQQAQVRTTTKLNGRMSQTHITGNG